MRSYVGISGFAMIASTFLILFARSANQGHDAVVVLCAASLAGPVTELQEAFQSSKLNADGLSIDVLYRGSPELLALHRISGVGDLLIAADVHYHRVFVETEICDAPMPLGKQFPCLIFTSVSEKDALSILNHGGVTTSLPKPQHAAIGRAVAKIVGAQTYQRMLQNARVSRETVTQVATDVSNGVVDVGCAWTTTPRQFSNLKNVVPPHWDQYESQVGVSVFYASQKRAAANAFRKFCASPAGQNIFADHGFSAPTASAKNLASAPQK